MQIYPIPNHATLPDMPSATNTDHDGRYYTEAEVDTMLGDGTIDHGSLSGLLDDDHPYLSLAGEGTNVTSGTFDMTTTGRIVGADFTAGVSNSFMSETDVGVNTNLDVTGGYVATSEIRIPAAAASALNIKTSTTSAILISTNVDPFVIDFNKAALVGMSRWALYDETGTGSELLSFRNTENLSGNKNLDFVTGDASRVITLSGNPTLGDWFDQAVKAASNVNFGTIGCGVITGTAGASFAADTDVSVIAGRAHVGDIGFNDFAGFSHVDQDSTTTYALMQKYNGKTYLNAATGQSISFNIAGVEQVKMTPQVMTSYWHSDTPTAAPGVQYLRTRGSKGSQTTVADNDKLGLFSWKGHDGTDTLTVAATILVNVDGAVNENTIPAEFVFSSIKPGDNDTLTDHMIIRSSGAVGIATITPDTQLQVVGDAKIGDDNTNYTAISVTGDVSFAGSATVWNDLQFQISDAKVTPASLLPSWEAFTANTSEYAFSVNDEVDTSANEIPHSWKEGTAGHAHIHITTKAINNAEVTYAKFTVTFAYADTDEVWAEAPLTAEITIANPTAALTSLYLDLGDITLTNYLIEAQMKCRVKRIAATTGTEYVGDIFITQIGIHFEEDTIGSKTEKGK